MSYYDFGLFLYDNILKYTLILILSILIYYILFRKYINSIFDLFFMSIFYSCAGFSVVILLVVCNKISSYYFYQYICTQIIFFIGFFLSTSPPSKLNKVIKEEKNIKVYLNINNRYLLFFLLISSIYILFVLYTYKVVGIPIFLEYRLASVGVGGGFGIINRFVSIFSNITFYFICLFFYSQYKRIAIFILIFYILFTLLSGSKSAILNFFTMLYLFYVVNKDYFPNQLNWLRSKSILFMSIATIGALGVLLVSNNSIDIVVEKLFFRIVSSGDVYYMAYCNDNIESLKTTDWWIVLTGDLFRTLRLIPEDRTLPGLGFELYSLTTGIEDALGGPNPRHNVFGYVHFGFLGSILYSFLCGLILGYIRKRFFNHNLHSVFKRLLLFLLYIAAVKIEADPPAFLSFINNMIILLPFFLLIEALVYTYSPKKVFLRQ